MADPAASRQPSRSSADDRTDAAGRSASGTGEITPGKPEHARAASRAESVTFANTKQHVADKQVDEGAVERFANTKLNIALINDPKNGPRFTLTKRESGLAGKEGDDEPEATTRPAPGGERTGPDIAAESDPEASPSDKDKATSAVAAPADPTGDAPRAKDPATSAAEPSPHKVPIDSSKTFVGRNGTYYDESWRWMDWRGTRLSWNWPAALSLGHWFAYRRLHLFAGLHVLLLAGVAAAAVNDVPILGILALVLLAVGLAGIYGNRLYFLAFRRAVDEVTRHGEGSYQELQDQLARAGGTSAVAPGVMAVLSLAGIAAAIVVTQQLRGGVQLNLWPF